MPSLRGCLLILLAVAPLSAQEWVAWRGPNGNGVVGAGTWNPAALSPAPCILWTTNVGMGHSAVAVRGQRLWTLGNRQNASGTYEDVVVCLDTRDGSQVWEFRYACPEKEDPGPAATPAVDGDRLYTLSREGHLYCLNTETGKVVWKRQLVQEGVIPASGMRVSSPLVLDETLVLSLNTAGLALNKRTGETVWSSEKGKAFTGSPVRFVYKEHTAVALPLADKVVAVNPADGRQLWSVSWSFMPDPIFFDNKMLAFSGRGGPALYDLSAETPVQLWTNSRAKCQFQSSVRLGDYAYGFGEDRSHGTQAFYCLDLKTGEKAWEETFVIWGSLIGTTDGHLVVILGQGELVIAQASPQGFKPVSRAQVVTMQPHDESKGYRRECHCWTNPVLVDRRIYIRNSWGELVCVDMR